MAGWSAIAEDNLDEATAGQIQANWNVAGRSAECADVKVGVIKLRVDLDPDGTVTGVAPLNLDESNACARAEYEKAKRAVLLSSPLKLPPGKTFDSITLRFDPDEALQ